jgi:4,5-dihydroxyphthalate decarboxylase
MSANAVPVKVALPDYHHTYEITSGAIALAGMSPTFTSAPSEAADIADMPLADYVVQRQTGDETLTAVPVFPARSFVHSWIHVATDGFPGVAPETTATVYARGLLTDRNEPVEDVVVAPRTSLGEAAGLRPLFDQPDEVERADYARTGVYPILSVIVIRTELLERERWLASNVFRAFEVTRRRYFARLEDIRGSRAPIPSVAGHVRALRDVFGPDLWPYGVERNRATLETFVRYAAEQGLIARALDDVADLFAAVEPFVDYTDGH